MNETKPKSPIVRRLSLSAQRRVLRTIGEAPYAVLQVGTQAVLATRDGHTVNAVAHDLGSAGQARAVVSEFELRDQGSEPARTFRGAVLGVEAARQHAARRRGQ